MSAPVTTKQLRKTYTVAMMVGTRFEQITNADPKVIQRVYEAWKAAFPYREIELFENQYVM